MAFLRRFITSIKTKLILSFLVVSFITMAAGITSIIPMRRLESSLGRIGYGNVRLLIRISDIKEAQSRILAGERTLLIRNLSDSRIRAQNYEAIVSSHREALEAFADFEAFDLTEEQKATWNAFRKVWDEWEIKQGEFLKILQRQEGLISEGGVSVRQLERVSNQAFDLAFSELEDFRVSAVNLLDKLLDMIQDNAIEAVRDSLTAAKNSIRWQTVFMIASFLAALGLGIWLTNRISRPILQGVRYIAQVAEGNIRIDVAQNFSAADGEIALLSSAIQKLIDTQRQEVGVFKALAGRDYTCTIQPRSEMDELGQSVARMIHVTNKTLLQVNQAVYQVTSGANAINNASQTMSQGAIETAASLEEISASIMQIGEKTKANAASADEADKLATSSREAVNNGYEAVAQLIAAMRDIQVTSTQIASVVKLIDDIAFQTNLLALNAAVEAARAGRHGRGFSIVADEVRSLAGRSAKAAKDTSQMLEQTVIKLDNGAVLAEHTDEALRTIVENAVKVEELFREIAKASNEQSLGISQIASGLAQIDRVTQHNTLTATQTASTATTLLEQAERLRAMMERFRLNDRGDRKPLMRRISPLPQNDPIRWVLPTSNPERDKPQASI
ncbi:MAG: methyl-accepting chemotaxis protein [Planctomycetota bacterium]|jgi:methyl-accepting chemotaxis protein|nr:methyl-accepting chemotaxis protein [Planctomycetota bacterium]